MPDSLPSFKQKTRSYLSPNPEAFPNFMRRSIDEIKDRMIQRRSSPPKEKAKENIQKVRKI